AEEFKKSEKFTRRVIPAIDIMQNLEIRASVPLGEPAVHQFDHLCDAELRVAQHFTHRLRLPFECMRTLEQMKMQRYHYIARITDHQHDFFPASRLGWDEMFAAYKVPPARQQSVFPPVVREKHP